MTPTTPLSATNATHTFNDIPPLRSTDARLQKVIAVYENLEPTSLSALSALYHPDARFKDPFQTVQGIPAIEAIFAHMFKTLARPAFHIESALCEGEQAFLTWEFSFEKKGLAHPLRIKGCTHLYFAADDRILWHCDYWDAATELYGKFPILGQFFRAFSRLFAAT